MSKLQNQDFKTQAQLESAGASKADLLNDSKIYVTSNGINKRLDEAILDGDIGGAGGGVGGVDIFFVQDFEKAETSDFTQTGLTLSETDPLKGAVSALLTHDASVDQLFKQVIPVDAKFRGIPMVLRLDSKSSASQGNLVIKIYDETNTQDIVASEQLQLSNEVSGKKTVVSFTIPESCESLSYTITALPEAGSPESIIDDIICELAQTEVIQSGLVQEEDSVLRAAGNAGQSITAGVTDIPFNLSSLSGSDIQFNGSTITILEDGIYDLSTQVYFTTSQARLLDLFVNGTLYTRIGYGVAADFVHGGSFTGKFTSGQVLSIRATAGGTLNNSTVYHNLNVTKQGSLKQVSVNPNSKITIPTSELRFEGASSRGSVATAIVKFDTLAKIRGDAFEVVSNAADGTYVQMKKAGRLSVSSEAVLTSANSNFVISKNQTSLTVLPPIAKSVALASNNNTANGRSQVSGVTDVAVGDVIRVASDSAITSNSLTYFILSFQEQEIQVSVSNTLPQFSESDLVVKAAGNNGGAYTAGNVIPFNTVSDTTGGAWNGTSFTVPESGVYDITASVSFSDAQRRAITIKVDGAFAYRISDLTTDTVHAGSISEYLTAGQVITLVMEGGGGTLTTNFGLSNHYLRITKVGKPNVTGVDVTPFTSIAFDKGSVGEIKAFAGPVDSVSFLECDGRAVSRAVYSELFDRIGTTHGQGDGSSTFNLPDYRGRFLRGVDGTAGRDPDKASRTAMNTGGSTGNSVGSVQGDQFRSHRHNMTSNATNGGAGTAAPYSSVAAPSYTNTDDIQLSGGNETRPINAYVNYGIRFKAANDAILLPSDSFSTDTASLQYAPSSQYTLSTLENAPVGTFITFTYAANTNTRTQTTTAPSQSTADMNANGIRIFTRAFNTTSTAAEPCLFAIQIGKGLKGRTLDFYKSIGKVTQGSIDLLYNASTNKFGINYKEYNEATGILLIDAGVCFFGTATSCQFSFSDATNQANGYLVINASKTLPLLAIPTPKVAYLKDIKPSGTAGGTFTSGAWQTRTLNTVEGDRSIVSLNANQFVLQPGKYEIEASAPAVSVDRHKIKLRNITDGSDSIVGSNEYVGNAAAGDSATQGLLKGIITITSPKVFEVQHRCQTTVASYGFGLDSSYDAVEIYAQVKITKLS